MDDEAHPKGAGGFHIHLISVFYQNTLIYIYNIHLQISFFKNRLIRILFKLQWLKMIIDFKILSFLFCYQVQSTKPPKY